MMSPLNKVFDKIYCINLDKRPDRWKEISVFFRKYNIQVDRFGAVNGNPMGWNQSKYMHCKNGAFNGAMGCIASHLAIWKLAKQHNFKSVLIIEDDCDLEENFNNLFINKYSQVPSNWDLLYFGGVHDTVGGKYTPIKVNDSIVIGKKIITTTCYAIKNTVYDLAINTIERDIPNPYTAVDGYLSSEIQPACNTYAFQPVLAWQRASHSDVQNGFRDYVQLLRKNNIK
jgi:glycosyl transferase family 25